MGSEDADASVCCSPTVIHLCSRRPRLACLAFVSVVTGSIVTEVRCFFRAREEHQVVDWEVKLWPRVVNTILFVPKMNPSYPPPPIADRQNSEEFAPPP